MFRSDVYFINYTWINYFFLFTTKIVQALYDDIHVDAFHFQP